MSTTITGRKIAYQIVVKDGRKHWLRIGEGFTRDDGSIAVKLDSLPTNGELEIRNANADDKARARATPIADAICGAHTSTRTSARPATRGACTATTAGPRFRPKFPGE